jgi:hypothetical protein
MMNTIHKTLRLPAKIETLEEPHKTICSNALNECLAISAQQPSASTAVATAMTNLTTKLRDTELFADAELGVDLTDLLYTIHPQSSNKAPLEQWLSRTISEMADLGNQLKPDQLAGLLRDTSESEIVDGENVTLSPGGLGATSRWEDRDLHPNFSVRSPVERIDDAAELTPEESGAEFKSRMKGSASNIIFAGATVARAKATYTFSGFESFCRSAGLDPKKSKCRKFKKIGCEADWLLTIVEWLPAEWTTIHDVSVLGKATAMELIRDGKLHPEITAKEIKEATNSTSRASNRTDEELASEIAERCTFTVDVTELEDPEKLALFAEIEKAVARHGLTVMGLPDRLVERLMNERESA